MTTIEWCRNADGSYGKSWNPIRARNLKTGRLGHYCEHVNEACRFCYSERGNLNARNLPFGGTGLPFKPGHLKDVEIFLDDDKLRDPLRWRKPQRVFVDSMDDPFGHWVKREWLDRMFTVMALCPQHTFILLTKRPAGARDYIRAIALDASAGAAVAPRHFDAIACELTGSPCAGGLIEEVAWPLPNVWLLVSCAEQKDVDEFLPILLDTPASVHGVSLEPLIGLVDLRRWMPAGKWGVASGTGAPVHHQTYFMTRCERCGWFGSSELVHLSSNGGAGDADCVCPKCDEVFLCDEVGDGRGIDWVIVGGESGTKDQDVRPMHPYWPLIIRDACKAANVPYFFKQWGEYSCVHKAHVGDVGKIVGFGTIDEKYNIPMARVGKKRAGRLLDGVEHNEWPAVREAVPA